jgi:hypothetical protein
VDKVLDADPKLKGAHADFKGEMGVKTIYQDGSGKQTKDYTVEGVCEVPGVPGNQEAGALIAHELQHAIDIEASGEPQKPGTAGAEAGEEAADKTQDAVNGDYKDPSDDVSKAQAEAAIPK